MKARGRGRGHRRERGLIRSLSYEKRIEEEEEGQEAIPKKSSGSFSNHHNYPPPPARTRDRAAAADNPSPVGPIRQSVEVAGTGLHKRHIVTYRQASWPSILPPEIQTSYTSEESVLSDLVLLCDGQQQQQQEQEDLKPKKDGKKSNDHDDDGRVIRLTNSDTGAYVSRPSTFCNLFETACPMDASIMTSNTTIPTTMYCNKHEADTLLVETTRMEPSTGRLVFCPASSSPSAEDEVAATATTVTGCCGGLGEVGQVFEDSMDQWFSYPEVPVLAPAATMSGSSEESSTEDTASETNRSSSHHKEEEEEDIITTTELLTVTRLPATTPSRASTAPTASYRTPRRLNRSPSLALNRNNSLVSKPRRILFRRWRSTAEF